MTDKMRWRYGDTNSVAARPARAAVIEIGDLVWQDAEGLAWAAHQSLPPGQTWFDGARYSGQVAFVERFLGVAMQRSRLDEDPIGVATTGVLIRVATTGVFEYECAPSRWKIGELVGAGVDENDRRLLNQIVEKVADARRAIGRCAAFTAAPKDAVLVDVVSRVMRGGIR